MRVCVEKINFTNKFHFNSKLVNKGIGVDNIHYLTDPLWREVIHM
jgi:predicted ribosome-associated RNA-binding protein Tma20